MSLWTGMRTRLAGIGDENLMTTTKNLKTKEMAEGEKGEFFVRGGPGSARLAPDSAEAFRKTRISKVCGLSLS